MENKRTIILGLESSCDETAAAIVEAGNVVRSSVVASQADRHARFGGVVPEIASRAHLELIGPVVTDALVEAGCALGDVDAVAAVHGPGLAGALLVGVSAGKALALVTGRPYVGVHHHEAHLYAAFLEDPALEPPVVTLVASGGHTLLVAMEDHGRYRVLGQTVDDAAGEAFDKVARLLGLEYPGGPAIDRLAAHAASAGIEPVDFPRPMLTEGLDFSFAGLKTAVAVYLRRTPGADPAAVAAGFQAASVDVLVTKLLRASEETGIGTVVIGGGVAANSALRARVREAATASGRAAVLPALALCTDNAAMVGAAAWWRLRADGPTPLDDGVWPNLRLPEATG